MQFTLSIKSKNEDLNDTPDLKVAAILREVARELAAGGTRGTIRDSNGNKAGTWRLTDGKR
jgi:hypothetical protein